MFCADLPIGRVVTHQPPRGPSKSLLDGTLSNYTQRMLVT